MRNLSSLFLANSKGKKKYQTVPWEIMIYSRIIWCWCCCCCWWWWCVYMCVCVWGGGGVLDWLETWSINSKCYLHLICPWLGVLFLINLQHISPPIPQPPPPNDPAVDQLKMIISLDLSWLGALFLINLQHISPPIPQPSPPNDPAVDQLKMIFTWSVVAWCVVSH